MRILLAVSGLLATVSMSPAAMSANPANYVALHIGAFDALHADSAAQFGLEYRFAPLEYGFRPTIGISADYHGGTYGYAGVNLDINLCNSNLWLIPNFMVGAYGQGESKDLGGVMQLRSGIELAYQFNNTHRAGIAFNHISNAGIYSKNPGAESILITYALPVWW